MTRDEILSELQSSLQEMFDIDPSQVVPSAQLRDDLDLDSIDAIDLAVRLKKLIGRRVELSVLKELVSVGDVVDLIERELASQNSAAGKVAQVASKAEGG
jgi:acyl carrier protein